MSKFAPLKSLERNRRSGIIGDEARASQYNSAIRAIAPAAAATGLDSIRAKTIPPKPSDGQQATAPIETLALIAGLAFRDFPQGKQQNASPSGRLIKNTHLQETCSVNHPPSTGPMAAVIDVKPDHVPMARPRSFSEKIRADQSQAAGDKQRPADSLDSSGNNQLEDIWCESAPGRGDGEERNSGRKDFAAAVDVSQRSADQKQRRQKKRIGLYNPLNVCKVARSAYCSAGRATFTTVPSMKDMLEPRMVAARIQRPFAAAGSQEAGENRAFVARRSGDAGHNPFSARGGQRPVANRRLPESTEAVSFSTHVVASYYCHQLNDFLLS